MSIQHFAQVGSWEELAGPNLGYAIELYERFLANPAEVDPETQALFQRLGPPPVETYSADQFSGQTTAVTATTEPGMRQVLAAQRLVRNLRAYGHLVARVNPLVDEVPNNPLLDPASYELTEADLAAIPAHWVWREAPTDVVTGLDAIRRLYAIYSGTIAYDFAHVHNSEEQQWLTQMAESEYFLKSIPRAQKQETLFRLVEVEAFERFLHRTFVGQKRFSIEGVDMLVPMLDALIQDAVGAGAKSVMMGMAHRGRLNVLAHILGKPYGKIFSEFHSAPNKELVPSEGSMGINYGWTGDVKYHLGASRAVHEGDVREVTLVMANNPSHLEFVNPVVEGFARAAQDDRSHPGEPDLDVDVSLAVLIHGDAAFPGEGVVAETLNMSRLRGYHTGGTIHIIANNQLGFTATEEEGRSTRYASDLAKGFEIPIVHVNADDPDACIAAVRMAHAYRKKFHKDFLIDLIGYRRWGHNEMDDPVMTQPTMYAKVSKHPTVRALYADTLVKNGIVAEQDLKAHEERTQQKLQQAYKDLKDHEEESVPSLISDSTTAPAQPAPVPLDTLRSLNEALLAQPPGFNVYQKLHRGVLERRRAAFEGDGKVDWAHGEALAFASILSEGTPIRMSGQDVQRGTFSQRHLVLHDEKTGATYCPLQQLPQAKASFAIFNSPLTEAAVIGFEYGYNVQAPETMVIWEAQFGDFANAGQVLIDQFLSSGRAKWQQSSGLVMLLPHGYEGQGPEHSSARVERYLQLSAENNWRVVNPTTAAQYFHLLRSQAAQLRTDPRPLIVMTPKSLLRNQRAASTPAELAEGSFQPVLLATPHEDPSAVRRLVLSSGKVGVDLSAFLEEREPIPAIAALRVEQLYPFPAEEIQAFLQRFPNLEEVVWLQEEPRNMGAWTYMEPRLREILGSLPLRYIGRPERSSPAEGQAHTHDAVQRQILEATVEGMATETGGAKK
ncbi:2-oxoglutarate dehydrogenase E1 component [Alicyclobacillus cycloheptanicus]|uniref:2-oxoglutarate dehydrogenase E1 component n=1 Tax=Alicyclobacillus cycloheptanicus TaxID=1457 RepID=A0ABT9XLX3_9BACL|nr:2-oxoglutarate dehydrogenase E1 component [Alicyclobacillus cycloheptanicus]MDQ0191222.1 2-oxoglutarate dehydrogenase E1 component [Alicyclobacillus cycloheptanicus]